MVSSFMVILYGQHLQPRLSDPLVVELPPPPPPPPPPSRTQVTAAEYDFQSLELDTVYKEGGER